MNGTAWFYCQLHATKHNISQTATRVYYNRVFRYYYSVCVCVCVCVWGGGGGGGGGACTQGKIF